jgi:leucyl aminopeptidase
MGPPDLAAASEAVAAEHGATCKVISGDALLAQNLPAIHAVGRAASRPPCLIDLTWGEADAPKVTLVGKGVCFDSGGLDIKPASAMLLMKKDMGGAAHALALGQAVMALNLPVRLRVLIAAVENSISADAFRPGDILPTRKGITVEVGNTDAEGRLVLCDALALAEEDAPDLLIDFATLTGAARVALGPELPALFTPDDDLARDLADAAAAEADPLWRLPLWRPYAEWLASPIADTNNVSDGGFAGAITAALFLQKFVDPARAWAHLDLYAWIASAKPGRPKGGEAMTLRACLAAIERRYN